MLDFFKGWRRKVGALTLVIACVFAAGWLRSLHSREFIFIEFEIPIGGRINVYSSANQLDILLQRSTGWYLDFGKADPVVTLKALNGVWFFDIQKIEEEIVDGVLQVSPGYEVRIYFYVIVIPLTLLSAYLLLTKPRPTKRLSSESQAAPSATPEKSHKSPD
ncbi:MAG: hypothetical protein WCH39_25885 [Schlesneria sp.]